MTEPQAPTGTAQPRRARGLDGLRAVAVVLVFAYHTGASVLKGGWFGVDIFYVLSGYLITTLLLAEHDATQGINLAYFYIRRGLRLFPALLVMLVIVTPFNLTTGHGGIGDTLAALFYYADFWYAHHANDLLTQTWSLAVEEQFYLLWPFILIACMRRPKLWAPVLLLAGVIVAISTHLGFSHIGTTGVYFLPTTYVPVLALGAAISFALRNETGARVVRALTANSVMSAFGVIVLAAFTVTLDRWSAWSLRGPLVLLCLVPAGMICNIVTNPDGPLSRALSVRPLVWLGRRSYAFYLWHAPLAYYLFEHGFSPLEIAGIDFPAALALSALSWTLVERPFLALKNSRFETRRGDAFVPADQQLPVTVPVRS